MSSESGGAAIIRGPVLRWLSRAVIAGALGAIAATPAPAWVQMQPPALWPDGEVPLHINLVRPTTGPLLDGGTWHDAARAAVETWNGQMHRLRLVPIFGPFDGPGRDNGRNEIAFSTTVLGFEFGGALGVTLRRIDGSTVLENDVFLNANYDWDSYRGPVRPSPSDPRRPLLDVRRVLLHELGHVIGLDHPDEAGQHVGAIMNSTMQGFDSLTPDDQIGAAHLYGPGVDSPIGPPTIHGPSSLAVTAGNPASFSISVWGWEPIAVQWFKDGVPIPGATSPGFTIAAVQPGDAGFYHATATNVRGTVMSVPAKLTVLAAQPPVLVDFIRAAVVNEHGPLILNSSATGSPPLTYTWRREGTVVQRGTDSTLRSVYATMAHAGNYTVEVSNAGGSVVSAPIPVHIEPQENNPLNVPRTIRLAHGERDPFSIVAGFSTAYGSRRWWHNLQWSRLGPMAFGAFSNTPFDPAVHAGSYILEVHTFDGFHRTDPLVVEERPALPPVILEHPRHQWTPYGEIAFLRAIVHGNLPVRYRWFRNGEFWIETDLNQVSVDSLQIQSSAEFEVEVRNSAGATRSRPARVTVLPQAPPALAGASREFRVGQQLTLGSTAHYQHLRYPLTFQWYRNQQAIPGATQPTLAFPSIAAGDAGVYHLAVTSAGGTAHSSPVELTAVAADRPFLITQQPADIVLGPLRESHALSFGHDLIPHQVPQIRWFRDGQDVTVSPQPHTSFNISLGPEDAGSTFHAEITHGGLTVRTREARALLGEPVPAVVRSSPTSIAVFAGQVAKVSIDAHSSTAPTHVRWFAPDGSVLPFQLNSFEIPGSQAAHAGTYRAEITSAGKTETLPPIELQVLAPPPPEIRIIYDTLHLRAGDSLRANIAVRSPVDLTLELWRVGGTRPVAAWVEGPGHSAQRPAATVADSGHYFVRMVSQGGSVDGPPFELIVRPGPANGLRLAPPPRDTFVSQGREAILWVRPLGTPPYSYQWRRDGVDLPGAHFSAYARASAQPSDSGLYTVVVRDATGASVESAPARLQVSANGADLVNLAARARLEGSARPLIAGFVVADVPAKRLLVRGVGPSLGRFGVQSPAPALRLEVLDADRQPVAINHRWHPDDTSLLHASHHVRAFNLDGGSADTALLVSLPPGLYTAVLHGHADASGVGLIEIYDVNPGEGRLVNLSTRAEVGTGEDVVIPGIVLEGEGLTRLLVRAVGPGLADHDVTGWLADPEIEVYDAERRLVAKNSQWDSADPALTAAFVAAGAFALPPGSRDAALLLELPPGLYTVVTRGVGGTTGTALLEVYRLGR